MSGGSGDLRKMSSSSVPPFHDVLPTGLNLTAITCLVLGSRLGPSVAKSTRPCWHPGAIFRS
eukprot:10451075-Heterocapsa_arctica.AAC.1